MAGPWRTSGECEAVRAAVETIYAASKASADGLVVRCGPKPDTR